MLFFASFVTTLGAVYVYQRAEKSSAELAIACVAIALPCLVLALVAAPWQIHLMLLTLVIGSYRLVNSSSLS